MAPTEKAKRLPTDKQPKARVSRYLKSVEAKVHEGAKASLLMKGTKCSNTINDVLKDLRALKSPDAKLLSRNNDVRVFEDATSIEFLCTKNDCSTFAVGSNNKKRPDNLVLGRTFDEQLLDCIEFGVSNFRSLASYRGAPKKAIGSKPMFLFVGDLWSNDDKHKKVQNLILDWFRGEPVNQLMLSGLDHVIVLTAEAERIYFRTYYVKLKKNPTGARYPVPLLTSSGPDMDLTIRRTQFAPADLWKNALKQPKQIQKKKAKNQKTNMFGETIGRIHLERQDISEVKGKRTKAIREAERREKEEEEKAAEEELRREDEEERAEFKREFGFDKPEAEEEGGRRKSKRTKR